MAQLTQKEKKIIDDLGGIWNDILSLPQYKDKNDRIAVMNHIHALQDHILARVGRRNLNPFTSKKLTMYTSLTATHFIEQYRHIQDNPKIFAMSSDLPLGYLNTTLANSKETNHKTVAIFLITPKLETNDRTI